MEREIQEAAEKDDLPTVQRILQQRAAGAAVVNLNATGGMFGSTALHRAAGRGHLRIVQALLQADGVQVDARDRDRRTPLHNAAVGCGPKNPRVVQALLQAGADPNAADRSGWTPLHSAIFYNAPTTIVEALLDGGADPEARDSYDATPLHRACRNRRLDVVKLLIERCGSECLTLKDREKTPLDYLHSASPDQKKEEVRIGKHILQVYAGLIVQSQGIFCLHSILQNAVFADRDGKKFQLPVGKLSTEYLQTLLEYVIVAEPGSLRALDANGLLPLQVACQLRFPDLVINVVLRPYPDALLQL